MAQNIHIGWAGGQGLLSMSGNSYLSELVSQSTSNLYIGAGGYGAGGQLDMTDTASATFLWAPIHVGEGVGNPGTCSGTISMSGTSTLTVLGFTSNTFGGSGGTGYLTLKDMPSSTATSFRGRPSETRAAPVR